MKRFQVSVTMVMVLLLATCFSLTCLYKPDIARAEDVVKVRLNGEYLNFPDQQPIIRNNRVLIPLSTVASSIGVKVTKDGRSIKFEVINDGKSLGLTDSDLASTIFRLYYITELDRTQTLIYVDKQVNGEFVGNFDEIYRRTLDTPISIINNRTMVPVRFFGNVLGAEVNWDQQNRIVDITFTGVKDPRILPIDDISISPQIPREFKEIGKAISGLSISEGALRPKEWLYQKYQIQYAKEIQGFLWLIWDVQNQDIQTILKVFFPTSHQQAYNMIKEAWKDGESKGWLGTDSTVWYHKKVLLDGRSFEVQPCWQGVDINIRPKGN